MKQSLTFIAKHKLVLSIIVLIADGLYFLLSDPANLPLDLSIIGWLLTAVTIYIASYTLIGLLSRLRIIASLSKLKVIIVSGFVYLLLVLQTMGQLSLRDIAALVPLVIVGYLYFRRSKSTKLSI